MLVFEAEEKFLQVDWRYRLEASCASSLQMVVNMSSRFDCAGLNRLSLTANVMRRILPFQKVCSSNLAAREERTRVPSERSRVETRPARTDVSDSPEEPHDCSKTLVGARSATAASLGSSWARSCEDSFQNGAAVSQETAQSSTMNNIDGSNRHVKTEEGTTQSTFTTSSCH